MAAERPGFTVPPDACDCHMHVFGDPATYPPAERRAYTPTQMGMDRYITEAERMDFGRVVIVQPSAYGTDNACTLDALRARPETTRAIAVIDEATPDAALTHMAALGVRGVRLNLVSNGAPDIQAAEALLRSVAERVAQLGWHVQIFALPGLISGIARVIRDLPVPVVIDHMGATDGHLQSLRPGFDDMLELLDADRLWVKVSGANRVSRDGGDFRDAVPVMRKLIRANPKRVVWGTDWPHIGPHEPGAPRPVVYMANDNVALLRLLGEAAEDDGVIRDILVDNPARLYGF
jgi:predicted TIM-barrel fold metal-dependent hydrolase